MDGTYVDRFAMWLAKNRYSRRAPLRAGGVGILAAMFAAELPWNGIDSALRAHAADATPAAGETPAGEVNIEGTWLCDQPYALCSMSSCERTPSDPKLSTCRCTVESGYSIGYSSCAERAPIGDTLISTFSTANVTSDVRRMICSESSTWANCLDMPCLSDADDPTQATCLCPLVESGDFITAGGDCDVTTCSSVIWSAASTAGNIFPIFETAMKQVDQPATLPATCPSAAASPVGTPA